ncbi:FxDxF family PEP-CTERM protein [Duganella sp. P38]|uniref:FxDxF family PEP-CTERM protein n=1 Tax=Duganella sp. P38 TaxID=3423949 RepID=UPI003D7BCF64
MKAKMIFASTVLALASSFASANDISVNAGVITQDVSNPYGHLFVHEAGSFSDTIDFIVPSGSLGTSANPLTLSLGGVNVFNITNLTYSIFSGTSGSGGDLWGTFLGNNSYHDIALNVGGAYHMVITGLADGTLGGSYGVSMVSGVPEPETYAMMLSGIGVLGFMARRRKKQAEKEAIPA